MKIKEQIELIKYNLGLIEAKAEKLDEGSATERKANVAAMNIIVDDVVPQTVKLLSTIEKL